MARCISNGAKQLAAGLPAMLENVDVSTFSKHLVNFILTITLATREVSE